MRIRERRYFATEFETRTLPDGTFEIEGHAAVFNRHSQDLGGFVEQVDQRAFSRTLKNNPDTRALFNHDPNLILGRTSAGTLDIATDDVGLYYRNRLPETSYARDLRISMERGDITQSSFGFWTRDDEWTRTESGMPLRTLTEVSLNEGDVSPVTFPAYLDADSGVRAAVRSLSDCLGREIEPDGISDALTEIAFRRPPGDYSLSSDLETFRKVLRGETDDEIASRSVDAPGDDVVVVDDEEGPATATPLAVVHARMLLELKRRS